MAKLPHQLLAHSLRRAKNKAQSGIIQSAHLQRHDRERLEAQGWLTPIIRGWYLFTQPSERKGDSTVWYTSFWSFVSVYLTHRFGKNYCLSANASIDLQVGYTRIPKQLLVMVKKGGSSIIELPFNTSLVIYQEVKTFPTQIKIVNQINVLPLPVALYRVSPRYFQQQPNDAQIALNLVDISTLSRELLSGKNLAAANRIIGAYEFLNQLSNAKLLKNNLIAAGYTCQPYNPFLIQEPSLKHVNILSPYQARIMALWQSMRPTILSLFPEELGVSKNTKKYFSQLEKIYVNDAYNSLSIEGYQVTEELINLIAQGKWSPDSALQDKNQVNAMAAKGYHEAFKKVKVSIHRIFQQKNAGKIIKKDLHIWYSALFSPSVKAGIIKAEELAGYRNHPVYIRNSMHTPLPVNALTDAMEAFFDCLIQEPSAAVRAVLGHFIFVFIHPYMDGNGRIGRFIMNSLLASGGFPWTIIQVAHRENYLQALEKASADQDIEPFTKFILSEMRETATLLK